MPFEKRERSLLTLKKLNRNATVREQWETVGHSVESMKKVWLYTCREKVEAIRVEMESDGSISESLRDSFEERVSHFIRELEKVDQAIVDLGALLKMEFVKDKMTRRILGELVFKAVLVTRYENGDKGDISIFSKSIPTFFIITDVNDHLVDLASTPEFIDPPLPPPRLFSCSKSRRFDG